MFICIKVTSFAATTCVLRAPGIYKCASTGDPDGDGIAVRDFISNVSNYSCGDTIVLDSGATYTIPFGGDQGWLLKVQTNCGNKYTHITVTRQEEIPFIPINPFDLPAEFARRKALYARIDTKQSDASIFLGKNANNFWITGMIFTSHSSMATNGPLGIGTDTPRYIANGPGFTMLQPGSAEWLPSNIWLDRIMMFPIEEELYGPAIVTNTDGRTWSRTTYYPYIADVENITISGSYIYGLDGYKFLADADNPSSAGKVYTAITTANPAVLSATGLSAALGLTAVTSGTPSCSTGDQGSDRCKIALIVGGTGTWLPINGPKMAEYVSSNSVRLWNLDRLDGLTTPSLFDSTGFGAVTGTVKIYNANCCLPLYAFQANSGSMNLYDNFFSTSGMIILLGGDDPAALTPAKVISSSNCNGSDNCTITFDHVTSLRVGDMIAVDSSNPEFVWSIYKTIPPFATNPYFTDSTRRTCTAVAINGTTVTCTPIGPQAIDVPPDVYPTPGTIRRNEIEPGIRGYGVWRGGEISSGSIKRNQLFRNELTYPSGKGFTEVKVGNNIYYSGNYLSRGWFNPSFMTTHSQDGHCPWCGAKNFWFQNSLIGGPDGQSCRLTLAGGDQVNSSLTGDNLGMRNILIPGCIQPFSSVTSTLQFQTYGIKNSSGFEHVTLKVEPGTLGYNTGSIGECTYNPHDYMTVAANSFIKNNIFGAAGGITINTSPTAVPCWSASVAGINYNVITDYNSLGTLGPLYPGVGNVIKPDYGYFNGSCTFATWKNCGVSSASGLRGTASDGKDPGVDIKLLADALAGWSEKAGLQMEDRYQSRTVNNPGAFQLGSTLTAISFKLLGGTVSTCSLILYTDPARITIYGDTNTAPRQACNRIGNVYDGNGVVTFVLGLNVALTPSTTYYYEINDGSSITEVGEFTTSAVSSAATRIVQVSSATAALYSLQYSASADMSSPSSINTSFTSNIASATIPAFNGVRYYYSRTFTGGAVLLTTSAQGVFVNP